MDLLPEVFATLRREIIDTILATVPEAVRRAACGTYMDENRLREETGLSRRSIRTLREKRAIPYSIVAGRCLYPSAAVFRLIDEGLVPTRASIPAQAIAPSK